MNVNQYVSVLLVGACVVTSSCRRLYENEPYSQNEFIQYANKQFRDDVEADGYSTNEFYPGELLGGYATEAEANVRKRREWNMVWKYRTEDWIYTIGVTEDGETIGGSDKPGGFGPKPGFQRGIKWLQQKPEQ